MKLVKSLYDYVLSWSQRKHAPYALSVLSFIEASFFPIPPDPLLLAMCLGKPRRSLRYAFLCSLFSVIGAAFGYFIGWGLWKSVDSFFFNYILSKELFDYVKLQYEHNEFITVLGAAFTPIPFKVFTLSAGVFNVNFIVLMVASAIGRSTRFFLEAILILFYGPRIKDFIDKYFNLLTILIFIIIVIIFLIITH